MGENTKNFALRAYRTEAEALERLAELKGVSQNEIINDLIARAYCEVDAIASRHKITGRLDGFSENYYFFEGVLIKFLGIQSTGEPMKEYRREDLEKATAKDIKKIWELYRAANYSLNAARKYFTEAQEFLLQHEEKFEELQDITERLDKAIKDLEEIYDAAGFKYSSF